MVLQTINECSSFPLEIYVVASHLAHNAWWQAQDLQQQILEREKDHKAMSLDLATVRGWRTTPGGTRLAQDLQQQILEREKDHKAMSLDLATVRG